MLKNSTYVCVHWCFRYNGLRKSTDVDKAICHTYLPARCIDYSGTFCISIVCIYGSCTSILIFIVHDNKLTKRIVHIQL
jgi:hypothetical protein